MTGYSQVRPALFYKKITQRPIVETGAKVIGDGKVPQSHQPPESRTHIQRHSEGGHPDCPRRSTRLCTP
ncbi:hypothetical protein BIW11_04670 [Tropilaelaps mercedesae]|uniref:Uncharacterized protein n=1 Tax=Tropilaelaps mercedesae TaxID=418985 RepID=A0A1V9X2N5_9ACAR|nr:hypothetical protein BIW11_04670 [Tropilaelaps mercedesae]